MGKAAKILQFWRSFLVASVPLLALPLLFVPSEGKVNMHCRRTRARDDDDLLLACGICLLACAISLVDKLTLTMSVAKRRLTQRVFRHNETYINLTQVSFAASPAPNPNCRSINGRGGEYLR